MSEDVESCEGHIPKDGKDLDRRANQLSPTPPVSPKVQEKRTERPPQLTVPTFSLMENH